MNLANLSAATGRLQDAVDVLNAAWTETQVHWNDGNSRKLDEKQLRPLGIEVVAAYAAIRGLADALAKAERECGPRQSMDESESL
jgi:hypothetical protein